MIGRARWKEDGRGRRTGERDEVWTRRAGPQCLAHTAHTAQWIEAEKLERGHEAEERGAVQCSVMYA